MTSTKGTLLISGSLLLAASASLAQANDHAHSSQIPPWLPRFEQQRLRTFERTGAARQETPTTETTSRAAAAAMMRSRLPAAIEQTPTPAASSLPVYQVLDVGTLGGAQAGAYAINARGEVIGDSETADGGTHAFVYADGLMTDLGTLGGTFSTATDVNDSGQISGTAETLEGEQHAFRWDAGVMQDLGVAGSSDFGTFSKGYAINRSGEVSGITSSPANDYHAFIQSGVSAMRDLGTLGDSYSTGDAIGEGGVVAGIFQLAYESHAFLYANGMLTALTPGQVSYVPPHSKFLNSSGHVAGMFRSAGTSRAFLYRDGSVADLGTLGGTFASAYSVNDADEVTGYAETGAGEQHAFRYDPTSGSMTDLGTLGGTFSSGLAINRHGSVVGTSERVDGTQQPFVYRRGQMIDLGLPGSLGGSALAINRAGQVTGIYQLAGDDPYEPVYRGFVATPIRLLLLRLTQEAAGSSSRAVLAAWLAELAYWRGAGPATCRALGAVMQSADASNHRRHNNSASDAALARHAGAIREALHCS